MSVTVTIVAATGVVSTRTPAGIFTSALRVSQNGRDWGYTKSCSGTRISGVDDLTWDCPQTVVFYGLKPVGAEDCLVVSLEEFPNPAGKVADKMKGAARRFGRRLSNVLNRRGSGSKPVPRTSALTVLAERSAGGEETDGGVAENIASSTGAGGLRVVVRSTVR